jgi:membrane-bound ClpP family serine protease
LASQTFIIPQNSYQFEQFQRSLLILVFAGCGMTILAGVLARVLHDRNKPQDTAFIQETEKLADYQHLLGRTGVTTTPLVPAGKAVFDDELVNVVSDGELIETDAPVEVIDVVGYRIVVRQTI